ncbi:MAG: proline--tRNA ligase [bacterium]
MKFTELFHYTLRETPSDAVIPSHQLMLRAGLIKQLASGIYAFLPLGYRAFRKIEAIVREEMDRAGAQELFMPVLQPLELWRESGRLDIYLQENILFRTKDREDRGYALGPTHEEVVSSIARARIRSYRDLPFTIYQIQTKFRDELRPRFGLMRAREFCMKDAYSFDIDMDGLDASYKKMYAAYTRIFERCGLKFRAVEADSGAIGGDASHEFMVLAETGEDVIVACGSCQYAANLERAEIGGELQDIPAGAELKPTEDVDTPNQRKIEEISAFLKISPQQILKTLIYLADGKPVAACVRGDHEINEVKLRKALKATTVELADPATIERVTGAPVGFAGPQSLKEKITIIMDRSAAPMINMVTGGCREDVHTLNVNRNRDFSVNIIDDIRVATPDDVCPRCGAGTLNFHRGIEVGHVFKLGTKYSKPMGVVFTDTDGIEVPAIMGCYGIGVGRALAAAIEQQFDANGIIWPVPLAPYIAYVMPISADDEAQMSAATEIYNELNDAGIDAILDDRNERPGVKFKDADLIGFPIRIVAGKALKDGNVEVQVRKTGEKRVVPRADVIETVKSIIKELS